MLKLDSLSFAYKFSDGRILKDFSFDIKKGEFVGVFGPSGVGKSTLAKIIAGHYEPDSGRILLNGINVTGLSNKSRILIHQNSDLFPWLRTEQQLALAGVNNLERFHEVLELVELNNIFGKFPFELSVGMQKRLALARALLAQPEVIILDETLSSLQLSLRKELASSLKHVWAKSGITFILISHLKEELSSLTTQVIEFPIKGKP